MKKVIIVLISYCFIFLSNAKFVYPQSNELYINEFMASNATAISDEAGGYDDWIEIYNDADFSINLQGFYLTDDFSLPKKWAFPGITIPAKGFFLIWADSDPEQGGQHTNFKLNVDGEKIAIFNGASFVDSLSFGQQTADVSFGREPDGKNAWYFFTVPTPGSANDVQNIRFAENPSVIPESGFYSNSIAVEIRVPSQQAAIYYSLDGSEPTEQSQLYSQPISIEQTTVIRARNYETGASSSQIISHTYIIDQNFDIATLSLITDPANLWSPNSGIYVNPDERGDDWERPVAIEFFTGNDSLAFSENAGIRIHGKTAQLFDKKPFRLYFRNEYGSSWLNYSLFMQKMGLDSFKRLVVHSGGTDMPTNPYGYGWTMIRDPLMHELTRRIQGYYAATRPVVLFLNGESWGIYNLTERIDQYYIGSNFEEWDVDLVENYSEAKEGDLEASNQLIEFFKDHDFSSDLNYESAATLMDLHNFTDYMIIQISSGNGDWQNNVVAFRPRREGALWRWIVWDMDGAFGPYGLFHNTLESAIGGHENSLILSKLLENQNYQHFFINRFADLLNTTFLTSDVFSLIDSLAATIENDISFETDRWTSSPTEWLQEGIYGELYDYAENRPGVVRDQLRNTFDLSGKANLTIEPPAGAGRIRVNSLTIQNYPWQGIYFQGIPIEVEAISGRGYQFKDWSDPSLPPIEKITLTLEGDYTLQAIFDFAPYSDNVVVINEINYNSATEFNPEDWIELYNPSQHKMNLSDWHVKDDDDSHDFTLPEGTFIDPQGYLVISHNQNFFHSRFPLVEKYIGNLNFGLSSGGDVIRIFDASLNLVDSVRFDDDAPWPVQADGGGSTLELIDPGLDNSLSKNWQASKGHGTPGKLNSTGWSSIQEDQKNSTVPTHAKLYQNYPNPFNQDTQIVFQIPNACHVKLIVFNLNGERIRTILNEIKPAGKYRVTWDGKTDNGETISSGIYIIKMKSEGFEKDKKAILLK